MPGPGTPPWPATPGNCDPSTAPGRPGLVTVVPVAAGAPGPPEAAGGAGVPPAGGRVPDGGRDAGAGAGVPGLVVTPQFAPSNARTDGESASITGASSEILRRSPRTASPMALPGIRPSVAPIEPSAIGGRVCQTPENAGRSTLSGSSGASADRICGVTAAGLSDTA